MNRTSAVNFLTSEYRELAVEAGFTTQQTTDAYGIAVDMSLRQLNYEETALATADVPQANIIKYIALLNYYALSRFSKLLAIRFDVKVPGPVEAARSQMFDRVAMLMKDAETYLNKLGLDVGGSTTGFEMGYLNLDLFEPGLVSGGEF